MALGIGLGALVVGAGVAYAAGGASSPAATPATAASYSAASAIPINPGSSITVPLGESLAVQNTGGTQVTTNNAAVVAPSSPATSNGFVALTVGTATLSIPPNTNAPSGATIAVTVVPSTGGAVGSSNPPTGAASIAFSVPASSALPSGSPQGLEASGYTSTGWEQAITVVPHFAGIIYQGFYGDVFRISLPTGAHWRATATSMGPASGTDPFYFTLIEPMTLLLSYVDSANVNQDTTLAFEFGGVFEPTTSIATGEYVIFALAQGDYQATVLTMLSALSLGPLGTLEGQEAQTIAAAAQAATGTPNWASAVTVTEVLSWIFLLGPWAESWGLDPHSVAIFPMGAALPAWWPAADTASAGEHHVLARYTGPGAQVTALPFPVTAYKRIA